MIRSHRYLNNLCAHHLGYELYGFTTLYANWPNIRSLTNPNLVLEGHWFSASELAPQFPALDIIDLCNGLDAGNNPLEFCENRDVKR